MTDVIKPAPAGSTSGLAAVALGWIIPGAGHLLLRRNLRGLLIFASVVIMFVLGIAMRGAFFKPQGGDLLTMIIYYGGFGAHLASGAPYLITEALGYNQVDVAGHVHDYGAKFLVGAGMLNVLAMVDAWEIATGQKD